LVAAQVSFSKNKKEMQHRCAVKYVCLSYADGGGGGGGDGGGGLAVLPATSFRCKCFCELLYFHRNTATVSSQPPAYFRTGN